ncbi:MAG: threonine aldolase family protein [Spirochaetota bacterium]
MSERFFASDNSAPVHPDVMAAIVAANEGHAISYGDERWTREATKSVQSIFGRTSRAAFVYNGTGANVLGIQTAIAGHHGIVCTDVSHIHTDECGAPERFTGAKLLAVPTSDGRMTAEQVLSELHAIGVQHHSQPRVVSLTQSTELGTVYAPELVREIAKVCHRNDLLLHVDGARIANAAVSLGSGLNEITGKLGVDILSLGGTKNGMMFGEAVVFFRPDLADAFPYIRKQGMQLASKMRYVAAQFSALFGGDLWRRLATQANMMAGTLAAELQSVPRVEIVYPVEANAVFARLPNDAIKAAQQEVFFYVWDEEDSVVRLMCSYDTTIEDVERLVAAIRRAVVR